MDELILIAAVVAVVLAAFLIIRGILKNPSLGFSTITF